ncbi:MAG: hypothetical protein HY226_04115 [Candidatus Vogelbacteria bacterium]|nr:hypothetical protein [Candidatus Vogelbacteria bacterium]
MKQDEGVKSICDYMFSFAKEMGYEDYVEYDEEIKKYFATWELDDDTTTRELIERYDDHTFWEEISEQFGERDFLRMYTKEEREKMTDDEHFTRLMECQIPWEEEFEKRGIDRLDIKKD